MFIRKVHKSVISSHVTLCIGSTSRPDAGDNSERIAAASHIPSKKVKRLAMSRGLVVPFRSAGGERYLGFRFEDMSYI